MNIKALAEFLTELFTEAMAHPDVAKVADGPFWAGEKLTMSTDTGDRLRRVYFHVGPLCGLRDWWAESPC